MEKFAGKLLKILSTVMVAILIILAFLLAGVRLVGLKPYTVLSGSMEPTYHVGSVIYVKDVDASTLKTGDPITFSLSSGIVVTHRITEVLNSGTTELAFITKGDANNTTDGEIPASAIIGKPTFTIPYLGYISSFVQTPKGLIVIIACTVIILVLSFLTDGLFKGEESSRSQLDKENNNG